MSRSARYLISAFFLLATASQSADARTLIRRAGHIPDDLREVRQGRALKHFEHRPWLTGSSIALLPSEKRLVVADTANNAVAVVDPATGLVHATVAVGRRPERLIVTPDGRVVVTNRGSRSISLIDPQKGVVTRTADAGVEPMGIALTANGQTLLVASSATAELLAFDSRTLAEQFRLRLRQSWPMAVAAHPDGRRVFVTHAHGNKVTVIDVIDRRELGSLTLPAGDTGLPGRLLGRGSQKRTPNLAFAATVSPGGTRLFVAHVMADTGANRAASVGGGGYGLGAASPLVATVSTFDLGTGKLIRPHVNFGGGSGRKANFATIHAADVQAQAMAQPVALIHNPKTARLLLVGHGSDRIMHLDTRASDPITRPIFVHAVGPAPEGVAITRNGRRAFVHASQGFSVAVLDLGAMEADGSLAATRSQRWSQKVAQSFEIARDPLPEIARKGRRLFTYALNPRVGGPNRFACASCHPDGRADGLTWQIGAGPRKTPILAARVQGTGPFNWLGTEDRLHTNVIQTVRRLGGQGITKDEAKAVSTYIALYMNTLDNPNQGLRAGLVAQGRQIFHSKEAACSTCHDSQNRFTDGLRHDVGTTTARELQIWKQFGHLKKATRPGAPPKPVPPMREHQFHNLVIGSRQLVRPEQLQEPPIAYNTPSLRYAWAQASFLHDGSQATLKALLTTGNRGDRMGKTSHLSDRQVDALVAYLKSL